MPALLDHRFLFVVGKGGVGKTTVTAALGLAAAREGKKTLIAMVNAKERLSTLMGSEPIGTDVVSLAPNLDAVNMTPQAALQEYGLMILKIKALYNAVFENDLVKAFLRGTPGIEAWTMLGKAYFHAFGQASDSKGSHDLVILDAPATGHGLDMLRVPQVIVDVAPPGLLRREAERALRKFRDPELSGAVMVTLPEDMPTNETIELHAALKEMGMSTPSLFVNQVLPRLFDPASREAIEALPASLEADSPVLGLADAGRARALREEVQEESLARLRAEIDSPMVHLPHLFAPEFLRAEVESLSHAIA